MLGRDAFTTSDDPHDLFADMLDHDPERPQHLSRPTVLHTKQAEQQMLGADVRVPQTARLLLGENNDLTRGLCESLEQVPRISPGHHSRKDRGNYAASSTLPIAS